MFLYFCLIYSYFLCSLLVERATLHWKLIQFALSNWIPSVSNQSTPEKAFDRCPHCYSLAVAGIAFAIRCRNDMDSFSWWNTRSESFVSHRPKATYTEMATSWRNPWTKVLKLSPICFADHLSAQHNPYNPLSPKARRVTFAGNKSPQELERTVSFKWSGHGQSDFVSFLVTRIWKQNRHWCWEFLPRFQAGHFSGRIWMRSERSVDGSNPVNDIIASSKEGFKSHLSGKHLQ